MDTKEFFKEPKAESSKEAFQQTKCKNNKVSEIPEKLAPQTTPEMTIALKFIKTMGENQAAEFIDTLLGPGDKVRIKKNIDNNDNLWGCHYLHEFMLGFGETAKIINRLGKPKLIGKGERYILDKDHVKVYSTPMFDLAYTMTENKHIIDAIKEMYNLPPNDTESKNNNAIENQDNEDTTSLPQGNNILNDFDKRLTKLESDIELIKEQIERITTVLLNASML